VRFLGSRSNEQVAELLSRARVLLAPSVVARDGNRESGLIVVKEASAAGTVPIASRHGGIPDSIEDGRTGFLVAERDFRSMGQRLFSVLRDERLRQHLARAGRLKMEREFDARVLTASLEDTYDAVCERAAVRRRRAAQPARSS
jgi:colanic acid/amylovoran biosynthesis glycosyltransferase